MSGPLSCPRVRKNRLRIDPMSRKFTLPTRGHNISKHSVVREADPAILVLPKLPRPEDLRPFPATCKT